MNAETLHPKLRRVLEQNAAKDLEIDSKTSLPELQASFLKLLTRSDFFPPRDKHKAFEALTSLRGAGENPPSLDGDQLEKVEDRLRQAIDTFAERYFKLSTSQRLGTWQELSDCCSPYPQLAGRMAELNRGLDLQPNEIAADDARVAEMARQVAELYVLHPWDRAIRRRELICLWRKRDRAKAAKSAKQLRKLFPAVAALDDTLITTLSTVKDCKPPSRAKNRQHATTSGRSAGGHTWVIVIGLSVLGRLLLSLTSPSKPASERYIPNTPATPNVSIPAIPIHDVESPKIDTPTFTRPEPIHIERPIPHIEIPNPSPLRPAQDPGIIHNPNFPQHGTPFPHNPNIPRPPGARPSEESDSRFPHSRAFP